MASPGISTNAGSTLNAETVRELDETEFKASIEEMADTRVPMGRVVEIEGSTSLKLLVRKLTKLLSNLNEI